MAADAPLAPAVVAAGWLGQGCFFARFFVQWLVRERTRRPVVPACFWWLSLAGAGLMSVYALSREVPLLLVGFAVGAGIAARNLLLAAGRGRMDPGWAAGAALGGAGLALWPALGAAARTTCDPVPWLAVGLLGQVLWAARFPLQWWRSERVGHSHFPASFWWLSLAGNLLLLAYAIHLGDAVFVLGFLPGPLLQIRNLVLEHGHARHA